MKAYETVRRAGQRLTPSEEQIRQKIGQLVNKLSQTLAFDQNAIRTLQYQIQGLQEANMLDSLKSIKGFQIDDESALTALQSLLVEEQRGIKMATETLIKDLKDLEIMKYGFQL